MSSLFASIALIHLVALMSPGPDFFFVTRTAMSQSRSKAMLGVLGITGGIFVWSAVSTLGLHILFETISWLQQFIAIAGGLYLLWMGIGLLKSLFNLRTTHKLLSATQWRICAHLFYTVCLPIWPILKQSFTLAVFFLPSSRPMSTMR